MVQINLKNFKRLEKERNTVHSKVTASHSVFNAHGEKYFQIDTYGDRCRKMPEKIGQSFQLDRTTSECLVKFIIKEFDLK